MPRRLKKIFLIDDDADDREIFIQAIRKIGNNIVCSTASDGDEGVALFEHAGFKHPDIIFLDLNMPRMSGQKFLAWIKEKGFNHIPIIIYSTSKNPLDVENARRLGACDYIVKPNFFENTLKVIRSAIESAPPAKATS